VDIGTRVIATTRNLKRRATLEDLGAGQARSPWNPPTSQSRSANATPGVDGVLDIVGNSTILDSLAMARRGGRVCLVGLLDHVGAIDKFNPLFQMPHAGVHFSSLVSWALGTPDCPSDKPFQGVLDRIASGAYEAKPGTVYRFKEIAKAHRLMESNEANGKMMVRVQTPGCRA
jgi:NADPH2:quinone reductase